MPLLKKASKKALESNIKTEMEANPEKSKRAQNLAIAYSTQREAKKMAQGGMAEKQSIVDHIRSKLKMMADGGEIEDNDSENPANMWKEYEEDALKEDFVSPKLKRSEYASPEDSNEHGDELPEGHIEDMISQIRRKLKSRA